MKTLLAALPALFALPVLPAQAVDNALKRSTVEAVGRRLADSYVFEDKGKECAEHLSKRLAEGAYDPIDNAPGLAAALTRDLQQVTADKHLRVRVRRPRERGPNVDREELQRRQLEAAKRNNFGFEKVERLPGNVGYIDLRGFFPAEYGGPTAVAAMEFVKNCDALIIDLRNNGGGSPSMIQLLSSYFFDEMTHLNSFFYRGKEQIDQFWTLPHIPGERRPDLPLFLLTSRGTFSAAEEFTYNLRNLDRATVVGETTGGGAHPGGTMPANDLFEVWVPRGRAINPITKTNWEGTGVEPHLEVPAQEALKEAHREALRTILDTTIDEERKAELQRELGAIK